MKAKVVTEKTYARPLATAELEAVIKRDYPMFDNGLYRYSDFKGDASHSYFVSKERLLEILKGVCFAARLTIAYEVIIDPEHCLYLVDKKDNGDGKDV